MEEREDCSQGNTHQARLLTRKKERPEELTPPEKQQQIKMDMNMLQGCQGSPEVGSHQGCYGFRVINGT